MTAPYPWLASAWSNLGERLVAGGLAHAYLLHGRPGLGIDAFAGEFARFVLCEQRAALSACGTCRGCNLHSAGAHPDLKHVKPEEDKKGITIDQIRSLIEFFTLRPHYRGNKVAIVSPAEAMNSAAANALLKILEEPPQGALLLLVSQRQGALPATIISRCQKMLFHAVGDEITARWLHEQLAQKGSKAGTAGHSSLAGAPLEQLSQLNGEAPVDYDELSEALLRLSAREILPVAAVAQLKHFASAPCVDALDLLARVVLELQCGAEPGPLRLAENTRDRLQSMANQINSQLIFKFLDEIALVRKTLDRSGGVRGNEMLENLLHRWSCLASQEHGA